MFGNGKGVGLLEPSIVVSTRKDGVFPFHPHAQKLTLVTHFFCWYAGDEATANEVRELFGTPSSCASSSSNSRNESFAHRAERLCNNVLARVGENSRRRNRKRCTPCNRIKEWTKNVVLIDYQGRKKHLPTPLYDYHKLFDGPIRLLSDMTEDDVRCEIVRLIKLKSIPTHTLEHIKAESFEFVKVSNRRVRQLDGDVPCDGGGLSHIYRTSSVYVRLKDTSLWAGDTQASFRPGLWWCMTWFLGTVKQV